MKKFSIIALLSFLFNVNLFSAELNWLESYDEAVEKAQKENKPMLMLFTGSDWCPWCMKLEGEVLNTEDFATEVSDKFVFLFLDFPRHKSLPVEQLEQNHRLKKEYSIRSFPTIALLDEDQQWVTSLGYRPGGPKPYTAYLLKTLEDFKSFSKEVRELKTKAFSSEELKDLYRKAEELGQDDDLGSILDKGLASEDNTFFLTEQYRRLLELEGPEHPETLQVKDELLRKDPANTQKTHYNVALIDFQSLSRRLSQENDKTEVVSPLVAYLERFGKEDAENSWRVNMTIAPINARKCINRTGQPLMVS